MHSSNSLFNHNSIAQRRTNNAATAPSLLLVPPLVLLLLPLTASVVGAVALSQSSPPSLSFVDNAASTSVSDNARIIRSSYKTLPTTTTTHQTNATAAAAADSSADADASPPSAEIHPKDATHSFASYNPDTAVHAAYYSKAAYCPAFLLRSWNCGLGCLKNPSLTDVKVFNTKNQMQSYVGYDPVTNQAVVVFRGSFEAQNWVEDFRSTLIKYEHCPDCRVHQGFLETYQGAAPSVRAAVKQILTTHPNANLFVTGHSLGAGEALLAALDLKVINPSMHLTLYTFGLPRTGNLAFAKWATGLLSQGTHARVTHADDVYIQGPLQSMGYHHVPHEIWYPFVGQKSGYKECHDSATHEDPTCSISLPTPNQYANPPWRTLAHVTYLDILIFGC